MRGSAKLASAADARPPRGRNRVVSYTKPQIGSRTPYSSQSVRLVKPILRPTGRSPRATRAACTLAATS